MRVTARLLLLFLPTLLFAKDNDKARALQLADRAKQVGNFFSPESPVSLTYKVKFYGVVGAKDGVLEGQLFIHALPGERWRMQLVSPNYTQISWKADSLYLQKSHRVTPLRSRELLRAVEAFTEPQGTFQDLRRIRQRKAAGERADCVETGTQHFGRALCFAEGSGVLLLTESQALGRGEGRVEYAGFREVGGRLVPVVIQADIEGVNTFRAELVEAFSPLQLQAEAIAPPAGLKPLQTISRCADGTKPKPAKPRETPDPSYTVAARRKKLQGVVTVAAVVGLDGRLHDPVVLQTLGDGMDEQALEALKKWRIDPPECNGKPYEAELTVEVAFRLY